MNLVVNGETYETGAATVGELLGALGIDPGRVAVELNLKIVKRITYGETALAEGDRVEIVNFVGGG